MGAVCRVNIRMMTIMRVGGLRHAPADLPPDAIILVAHRLAVLVIGGAVGCILAEIAGESLPRGLAAGGEQSGGKENEERPSHSAAALPRGEGGPFEGS